MTINRKTFNRGLAASSVLTALTVGNAVCGKAVEAAIKSIRSGGERLDNQIHGTAVATMYLSMSVAEEGPASGAGPAVRLMNAMPRGSRAKALAAWFEAFSNVRLTFDKGKREWTGKVLPVDAPGWAVTRPTEAMDKPFWTVDEADVDPKAFTLGAALAQLLKKAEQAATKGELSDDDKAVVEALRKAGKKVLVEAKK